MFKDKKLYIFDMDGLLFDSEKLYLSLAPKILKKLSYTNYNKEIILKTIGMTHNSAKKVLLDYFGFDFPFETYSKTVFEYLIDYNQKYGIPVLEGVVETLEELKKQGKKLVVASSSKRYVINEYMTRNKLDIFFDDYVSGDDVVNGKPNPEIFLKAAQKFGVEPCDCVVFEDSHNGIRAARNANMTTIMIPNILPVTEEMKNLASLILPNMKDFLKYLKS